MVWTFLKDMPGYLLWWYLPQHIVLNLVSLAFYASRGQAGVVWKAKLDAISALPALIRQRSEVQRSRRVSVDVLRRAFTHGVMGPYLGRYSSSAQQPVP